MSPTSRVSTCPRTCGSHQRGWRWSRCLSPGSALFVYGVGVHEWYLTELTAVFLGMALSAAVAARLSPNRVARAFYAGAAELTTTAIIVGFARTIQVVLTEGQVIDTVINGLASPLQAFPGHVAALGMLAVQTLCNLFIPSGSGQAYVTMPIMAPDRRSDAYLTPDRRPGVSVR